ncbi:coenzyme F420-0:L-glutamate ligase [Rhizorhabdus dicambivorans]|uniref:Coenzyme F420-0:L-glutamate ligase n=1 Tax=Rhizorhabdus dicambivorans TaxID=1850238 RepID=A0A2A4FX69_9SPHN|nr:coenzyme F420-0:L-glutamate ligase [Rhizorhabdus dicambivorans]ATE65325.1 coenzyme F420-0:L-glutamate ligase [Rhizorhabdus dicambivorans]PCE42347.1 coenzyme F420-0:L-glutamate ligase [Rhizorhabdus dicambivorans]
MTDQPAALTLLALSGVPMIEQGSDLASVILDAVVGSGQMLADGDVVVLAQKIVSKAEGRLIDLATVAASAQAADIAKKVDKDPRLVELILSEAKEVMRVRPGVLIVRHRLGLVLANAGIDQSNIEHDGRTMALMLPIDPDASAQAIRAALKERTGADVAVLIIDSLGRAWRTGTTGTAIGVAGMPGLLDLRGREDLHGRRLETSELGLADEVAAAASLVMGQADEGRPIVLVRGIGYARRDGSAAELIRPRHMDLFA